MLQMTERFVFDWLLVHVLSRWGTATTRYRIVDKTRPDIEQTIHSFHPFSYRMSGHYLRLSQGISFVVHKQSSDNYRKYSEIWAKLWVLVNYIEIYINFLFALDFLSRNTGYK